MSLREEKKNLNLGERSKSARKQQKLPDRGKVIMINIALALVIVMVALTVKAMVLDKNANRQKTQDNKKVAEATQAPSDTPAPTNTPEPVGAERWLRKDLDASKPMVALTFDDGPYSKVTRRILKSLQDHGGRATFFVVGNRIETFAETMKLAYDQGNQIGSHTYDHSDLRTMSVKQLKKEVKKTNKAVSDVIGCNTTTLRPPYGNVNKKMRKTIPVPMIYWSLDSEDWKSRDAKAIIKQCKSVKDGDIILMHDLYPSTAAAVEKLVPKLVKEGYQLVTIDELFYYKGIQAKGGKVYYSGR